MWDKWNFQSLGNEETGREAPLRQEKVTARAAKNRDFATKSYQGQPALPHGARIICLYQHPEKHLLLLFEPSQRTLSYP